MSDIIFSGKNEAAEEWLRDKRDLVQEIADVAQMAGKESGNHTCRYCGCGHSEERCQRVKSIEYTDWGDIRKVEFHPSMT